MLRTLFLSAIVLGVLAGGIVAGVRMLAGGGDPEGAPASATAAPAGEVGRQAEAFARAWTKGDTTALYLLLDVDAQRRYSVVDFEIAYESFFHETTAIDLTATVVSVSGERATLAVRLSTAYFEQIEYTTVIAFTRAPSGKLGVRWSPDAIHPGMSDTKTIKSEVERPVRGTIFDRNGAALAITRDVRNAGLNRAAIRDRGAATAALVDLGFARDQVEAAFASPAGANQRVPVGPLPDDKAEAALIVVRTIPGILLYFESRRVHPLGADGAHAVGYTRELTADELKGLKGQGYRPGDRAGATGLEASLEAILAGKPGGVLRIVDHDGGPGQVLAERPAVAAKDVTTTLDANVLRTAQARLGSRAGAAVVIDPVTNAVLALNSSPSFDPDAFERNDRAALARITEAPGQPQTNRATAGLYSGGSTFKTVTGAAGMAYGGYGPSSRLECGSIWRGVDPPRRNWEGGQGMLTIAEGLMRSCNTVFYEIALTLYNKTGGGLSKMARAFGFGAPSGIAGLAEEEGLVPDARWKRKERNEPWYPGDEVNLGIGQGDLLITPLQLANAYSTLVNGALRTPVILAGETAVAKGELPLTAAQLAHLKLGLQLVTGQYGTASAAFYHAGYTNFAGKSGTAEDAGNQQHVLFVAYAPAAAPRAVAAVVLDEGASGSIEAGPIARDIILAALK